MDNLISLFWCVQWLIYFFFFFFDTWLGTVRNLKLYCIMITNDLHGTVWMELFFTRPSIVEVVSLLIVVAFYLWQTSTKLVFPTPLAPKKAALTGPRYHCVESLASIVIRYAEYKRFCICICSIAANDKAAALVPVNVPGDDRPATTLLAP